MSSDFDVDNDHKITLPPMCECNFMYLYANIGILVIGCKKGNNTCYL